MCCSIVSRWGPAVTDESFSLESSETGGLLLQVVVAVPLEPMKKFTVQLLGWRRQL